MKCCTECVFFRCDFNFKCNCSLLKKPLQWEETDEANNCPYYLKDTEVKRKKEVYDRTKRSVDSLIDE